MISIGPVRAIATLKAFVSVCAGLVESLTRAKKLYVPAVVGVPEMTPVPLLSDRPAGSEPLEIDQVYGVVPPLAVNVPEYDTPMVPPGIAVLVIVSGVA